MAYVTPVQLADGSGAALELAQLFDVSEALMIATIQGGDRDDSEPEDIAKADAALDSIVKAIALADGECDSRLAVRGYALPIDVERFPVLTVWARSIARYHLNRNRDKTDEERGRIERDYRDALRSLDLVAAGKLSLGSGDPLLSSDAGGSVQMVSNERIFSRHSLGRL
jgi:phage gp36-like protein